MELPIAGLGLGVFAQVRTVSLSIAARIENIRQGPQTFQSLSDDLALLARNIDKVDNALLEFPEERRAAIFPLFKDTLYNVHVKLLAADAAVEKEFSNAFVDSRKTFKGRVLRVFRATSLSKKLKAVETQIKESSGQLQHISTLLAGALNALALHNDLIPKLDNLAVADSAKEEYRPSISAPTPSHTVYLKFTAKDAHGRFETPEGKLKWEVLSSGSSETVTAATGIMTLIPAYGVVGMAGVGKTVALQGLAADEEVCRRFPDGVLYMTFGQNATVQNAIEEIAHIMKITGASSSIEDVQSSVSLKKAVDLAAMWFRGKVVLFLLDDLWPTDECEIGYLNELRQLLRCSQESRMAISTRSVNIAIGAGSVVDFAARDTLISFKIFMTYATGSAIDETRKELDAVKNILSWCGGLPIALSVTGCAVKHLMRTRDSFERACEIYVRDFEKKKTKLGHEKDAEGTRLTDGIRLSLEYLEVEFSNWKLKNAVDMEHTISDLYISLCILKNQVWIPVSVLRKLWKVEESYAEDIANFFCKMSLATLSCRNVGEDDAERAGLTLHDLHLEFCKQEAESKNSTTLWHSLLLNGYWDASSDFASFDLRSHSSQQVVDATPRPWWSIPEDGYSHANLARHLWLSGHGAELAALLLDARWLNVRGEVGGILGLKADFEILDKLLGPHNDGNRENRPLKGIRKSFQLIAKAMQLSWGSFSYGPRALQFQMLGRLLSLRTSDVIIDAASKSFEDNTPKPYLMPVSRFFPELDSAQILEIPMGGACYCVDCSPCGCYIAAGRGKDIKIADLMTGDVLKSMEGHSGRVLSIRFAASSKKMVSASQDNTLAVWEWEKSGRPILTLEGHSDWVTSVDVSSDGTHIVSGSRDCTVRLWNGATGLQTDALALSSAVWCVALCPDDKKVAIGLDDGTVKVLDGHTRTTLFEDKEAHVRRVTSVAFSSDGGRMATCSYDRNIRLWDADTWAAIGSPVTGHTVCVNSVAFSPNGQQLVSGSYDRAVRLWDVAPAGSVGASSNRPVLRERNVFFSGLAESVTFTCDGKRIVSGSIGGSVRIWDVALVSEETQRNVGHNAPVLGVCISPDGLRVASGSSDETVRLWDTQTGVQIGITLEGHTGPVRCVLFNTDGRHLVSGSWDRTLRMWDTVHFTETGTPFEGHSACVGCVSFSSDGRRILSGGSDKTVRLWNVQTREQIGGPLIGHTQFVRFVSESADGRFLVSRDENEETIIWDRNGSAIVWRSQEHDSDPRNRMTNIEAESVIRSCGHETPHLWPSCLPKYTSNVSCLGSFAYSDAQVDKIALGIFPSFCSNWKYDYVAKLLAGGLTDGGVAICRLVEKTCPAHITP